MGDGILLVDKPAGCTSADVVRAVKRRHRPASIGHLGTLDPMATGVLPLCLGAGTRVAQFLGAQSKAYTGTIRLGERTDTADVTGRVVERRPVPAVEQMDLEGVARSFLGEGQQIPPMYSAIRRGGRRLYELARDGVEVERPPRPIRIDRFRLTRAQRAGELSFEVACSKGTYVRVLAEDVGAALGTLGTLADLRRTEFGDFFVSECEPLDRIVERLGEGAMVPVADDAVAAVARAAENAAAEAAAAARAAEAAAAAASAGAEAMSAAAVPLAKLAEASAPLTDDRRIEWYGPSMSSKSFLTARLMEAWAHGQDIVDTVGGTRVATDRLRHIAQLGVITRGWSYANRGLERPAGEVSVSLTAPSGDTWTWEHADEVGRVTGTAEDFCLVVTQRRHLDDTGLVASDGPARDWMLRAQAFAGDATDGPAPRT